MFQVIFWLYLLFNVILIIVLLRIIGSLFLLIVFHKHTLPFVPTTKRLARHIAALPLLDQKQIVMDLGSGTGTLLAALHQRRPLVQYYGVEQSGLLVWLSRLRFAFSRYRPVITQGDLFHYPIHTADVIVGFWISDLTPALVKKFEQECKPGCYIISLVFALPASFRVQLKTATVLARSKVYIYEKI